MASDLAVLPSPGIAPPAVAAVPPPAPSDPVEVVLAALDLDEAIGQLLAPVVYGSGADEATPAQRAANRLRYGVETAGEVVARWHVGGVIYLDRNTLDDALGEVRTGNVTDADGSVDTARLAALSDGLQAAAAADTGVGLLLAVDQEGGPVTRVGPPATQFPAAAVLGAVGREDLTEAAAFATGQELRALGIRQVYAPVADVNVEPDNPVIGVRAFGDDPGLVGRMVAAQVRGFAAAGVAATVKHFPGHGDTTVDSHVGLPLVHHSRSEWTDVDRPPFAAAILSGAPAVMTGHLAVPALDPTLTPATLSAPILTGELRDGLGFDGLIVTDSLFMAAVRDGRDDGDIAVAALAAGGDVLLMPPDLPAAVAGIRSALEDGRLDPARFLDAVRRVLRLKAQLGVLEPQRVQPTDATLIGAPAHDELRAQLVEACGCPELAD